MMKSAFFKKPARKARYLAFLKEYLPKDQVKLPPVPASTRWNSWFNAVMYHATHLHVFFKKEESKGMAVEQIIELTSHKEISKELRLYTTFIKENCSRLMSALTSLEATHDPLACTVYNSMQDLSCHLQAGTSKTSYGAQTDALLQEKPPKEQEAIIKSFKGVFKAACNKLQGHLEEYQAFPYYKAARVFDPRQLGSVSHDISDYQP